MNIPMLDPRRQYLALEDEINKAVREVLQGGAYILGPNVQELENELAEYLGVRHTVGVASGTDALHLALRACGVGPGDEVITSPFTFIATVEAILYCGAEPVFVDIEHGSFNIAPERIEEKITPKTKALLPVHLYGNPAGMDTINAIAQIHGLRVIEDCAQSIGATYKGDKTGSLGDCGCFSFYPTKNLGAMGDGGLISTDSTEIYEELCALRNHGCKIRYYHDTIGFNSRLDEIQAAILRIKLRHLDTYNRKRQAIAARYNEKLASIVDIPTSNPEATHVYHQYTILHEGRDTIQASLNEQGVSSAIYYPVPLHRQALFGSKYAALDLPHTEFVTKRCLSLPIYPELEEEGIDRICEAVTRAVF